MYRGLYSLTCIESSGKESRMIFQYFVIEIKNKNNISEYETRCRE